MSSISTDSKSSAARLRVYIGRVESGLETLNRLSDGWLHAQLAQRKPQRFSNQRWSWRRDRSNCRSPSWVERFDLEHEPRRAADEQALRKKRAAESPRPARSD
jgi:hypothetical protein